MISTWPWRRREEEEEDLYLRLGGGPDKTSGVFTILPEREAEDRLSPRGVAGAWNCW